MLAFCTASDLLAHPLPLPRTHNNKIETVALEAQRGNINHGKKSFYGNSKSESTAKAK